MQQSRKNVSFPQPFSFGIIWVYDVSRNNKYILGAKIVQVLVDSSSLPTFILDNGTQFQMSAGVLEQIMIDASFESAREGQSQRSGGYVEYNGPQKPSP